MDSIFYFLEPSFWESTKLVLIFSASIFGVLILRYFATATLYRSFLKNILGYAVPQRKNAQLRKEIYWSVISSLIFTALAVGTFFLFQRGYTRIYTSFSERSIPYFIFSIGLVLVLYETYYYWLHRWMHRPSVFRIVHRVHHESIHPTVFTSFSFHPIEAVLQFIFLPIAITLIPIHYYALGIVLLIMTVSAVINHAGVEIFPGYFAKHPIGKWLIGSTHHDIHHKEFKTNYGLYLSFWDKWMKTESENFERQFERNKAGVSQSRSPHRPSTGGLRK
ncbi:MAG TPA: sterol desaturase family protein [Chryseosolibacter sp.]